VLRGIKLLPRVLQLYLSSEKNNFYLNQTWVPKNFLPIIHTNETISGVETVTWNVVSISDPLIQEQFSNTSSETARPSGITLNITFFLSFLLTWPLDFWRRLRQYQNCRRENKFKRRQQAIVFIEAVNLV